MRVARSQPKPERCSSKEGARPSRSHQSASRRLAWVRVRLHHVCVHASREGFRRDAENYGRDARAPQNQLHRSG